MKITKLFFIICLSFTLLACGGITSLNTKSSWDPSKYSVQYGDTLYSIAWRYNLDFKMLAKWNSIKSPYLIVSGQRLIMTAPVTVPDNKIYLFGNTPSKHNNKAPKTKVVIDYSQPKNIPKAPPLSKPKSTQTTVKKSIPKYNNKKPKDTSINKVPASASVAKKRIRNNLSKGPIKWAWPINGKVISRFAANNHDRKGIDIKGKQDQKVKSAGSGVVVYSGAGLISYGKLVIIKHSDRFLSAYAFNKRLLVKEGALVKKGQSIAIVGKKLNVTNLLHFEIRKDGKPVNPLVYLP